MKISLKYTVKATNCKFYSVLQSFFSGARFRRLTDETRRPGRPRLAMKFVWQDHFVTMKTSNDTVLISDETLKSALASVIEGMGSEAANPLLEEEPASRRADARCQIKMRSCSSRMGFCVRPL